MNKIQYICTILVAIGAIKTQSPVAYITLAICVAFDLYLLSKK